MTDEQTKQAILGFAEFFKGITGNQDLKIPNEIAEKCGIQAQTDGEYITQSAGDEIRQKNYDLISRQAVLEQINCWIGSGEYRYTNATYYLTERVKHISPVKPQEPKAGHWIDLREDNEMSDDDTWRYSCNMCHSQNFRKTLFCPNCGCAMVEPQEGANE